MPTRSWDQEMLKVHAAEEGQDFKVNHTLPKLMPQDFAPALLSIAGTDGKRTAMSPSWDCRLHMPWPHKLIS